MYGGSEARARRRNAARDDAGVSSVVPSHLNLLVWVALAVLASATPCAGEAPADVPPDVFAQALADMGITEADLGQRPKGYWNRYPLPSTIPYVMPFFSDLLSDPLATYEFTRTLGNAIEDHLTPQAL